MAREIAARLKQEVEDGLQAEADYQAYYDQHSHEGVMDIYVDDGSELHVGASHEMTKTRRRRLRKARRRRGNGTA